MTRSGNGSPTQDAPVTCPSYADSTLPAPLPSPTTTAEVGTIPGTFAVTASGQATYTMPLTLPPGVLGMEPHLSIAYDSSAGESYTGVGFALGGLSSIRRCPSNVAQDGFIRAVQFNDTDNYCLDGLRLIPVGRSGQTTEYRTFPDTFSKIIGQRGGDNAGTGASIASFTVYTKAGHIMTYGATIDSRAPGPPGWTMAWLLNSEVDRHGNTVAYTYSNEIDPATGAQEIVPRSINYASAQVTFVYQSLPATAYVTTYESGIGMRRTRMLHAISTSTTPGGAVRQYHLSYRTSPDTQRQLLTSIEECTGTAPIACKPPTSFDWTGHAGGFDVQPQTNVVVPNAPNVDTAQLSQTWILADVTGDGLDDIVMCLEHPGNSSMDDWYVARNYRGTYQTPELWATIPHPPTHDAHREAWTITPVDINQDGYADLFLSIPDPDTSSGWPTYVYLLSQPFQPLATASVSRRRPSLSSTAFRQASRATGRRTWLGSS